MAKGKFEKWRTPEGLTLLRGWAREGLTDEQIAKRCGVRRQTIYEWSAKYPDISDALKKGREVIDLEVEDTLLKRVFGYDCEETRTEFGADGKVEKTVSVRRHVPPDTGAIAFWLKNRRKDRYRDRWPEPPAEEQTGTGCIVLPEAKTEAGRDG